MESEGLGVEGLGVEGLGVVGVDARGCGRLTQELAEVQHMSLRCGRLTQEVVAAGHCLFHQMSLPVSAHITTSS